MTDDKLLKFKKKEIRKDEEHWSTRFKTSRCFWTLLYIVTCQEPFQNSDTVGQECKYSYASK